MLSQESTAQNLQIQVWPIDRLVHYVRNPRKNDAAVDRMCSSIREFGFKIPVLARSNGEIVDGHLRLKAARKLGTWPGGDTNSIPVIACDEWTDAQVKAFRLLVNRSVTWAAWDDELLTLELQDLKECDFDLSLTGFEDDQLAQLLAQDIIAGLTDEDSIPDVLEAPISVAGDLWHLGPHVLSVGNATNQTDVARLMNGHAADLVFTDPPYTWITKATPKNDLPSRGTR
jgi:ParB-like chromosome segregation protein Spo0J